MQLLLTEYCQLKKSRRQEKYRKTQKQKDMANEKVSHYLYSFFGAKKTITWHFVALL